MPVNQLTKAQKVALKYYRARLGLMQAVSTQWAGTRALDLFTKPYAGSKLKDPLLFRLAEKLELFSDGVLLHGYKWTSSNRLGKRLLIVHGFSGNSRKFERYIEAAMEKGYDVYAYDAPAHGRSGGTRLHGSNYLVAMKDILAQHGHFDAYIGHSLGGLTVMLALDEAPASRPARIILLAPATESKTAADNFFRFLNLPDAIRSVFDEQVRTITGHYLEWFSISRVLQRNESEILWVHDEDDPTTPIGDVWPIAALKPQNVHFYFTKGLGGS